MISAGKVLFNAVALANCRRIALPVAQVSECGCSSNSKYWLFATARHELFTQNARFDLVARRSHKGRARGLKSKAVRNHP
jgi:hypothetical protein